VKATTAIGSLLLATACIHVSNTPAPDTVLDIDTPPITPPAPSVLTVADGDGPAPGTYVDLGASGLGAADFTISHWYATTFAGDGFLGDVLGDRESPSHGNFVSVRMNGHGELAFEVDGDDDGTHYTAIDSGAHRVNDGRWHYLAYTRHGGELAIYIDGEEVARGGSPADAPAKLLDQTPFRLGRSLPPCCQSFVAIPGAYADVRILAGRALDADEVAAIAHEGATPRAVASR
jgi:hypothetical protein